MHVYNLYEYMCSQVKRARHCQLPVSCGTCTSVVDTGHQQDFRQSGRNSAIPLPVTMSDGLSNDWDTQDSVMH